MFIIIFTFVEENYAYYTSLKNCAWNNVSIFHQLKNITFFGQHMSQNQNRSGILNCAVNLWLLNACFGCKYAYYYVAPRSATRKKICTTRKKFALFIDFCIVLYILSSSKPWTAHTHIFNFALSPQPSKCYSTRRRHHLIYLATCTYIRIQENIFIKYCIDFHAVH